MSRKSPISIIVGISIVIIIIVFAASYSVSPNKKELEINDNAQIEYSPIINNTTMETNTLDSFVNENGTKTYVINAIDSPILQP
jgi:uncharacterized protein YpmB